MLRRGMWHLVTWGYTASQKMHAEILTILVAHARALAPRGTEDGALALRLNRDHLSAIHVRLLPQSADTGKQSITPVSAATCSTYGSGGDRNDPSRRYGDSHQRRSMPCCWQSLKKNLSHGHEAVLVFRANFHRTGAAFATVPLLGGAFELSHQR